MKELIPMLLPMFAGLMFHITLKWLSAVKVRGYRVGTFIHRNWPSWCAGLVYSIVGVVLYKYSGAGIQEPEIVAFLIGLSGGSLGKNSMKIAFNKNENK